MCVYIYIYIYIYIYLHYYFHSGLIVPHLNLLNNHWFLEIEIIFCFFFFHLNWYNMKIMLGKGECNKEEGIRVKKQSHPVSWQSEPVLLPMTRLISSDYISFNPEFLQEPSQIQGLPSATWFPYLAIWVSVAS